MSSDLLLTLSAQVLPQLSNPLQPVEILPLFLTLQVISPMPCSEKGIWLNNIFSLPPFPSLLLSSLIPSIQEQLAAVTKAEGGKMKENKLMVER